MRKSGVFLSVAFIASLTVFCGLAFANNFVPTITIDDTAEGSFSVSIDGVYPGIIDVSGQPVPLLVIANETVPGSPGTGYVHVNGLYFSSSPPLSTISQVFYFFEPGTDLADVTLPFNAANGLSDILSVAVGPLDGDPNFNTAVSLVFNSIVDLDSGSFGGAAIETLLLETGLPQSFSIAGLQIYVSSDVDQVPEPSTLVLLGTGLSGLWVLGRKKFKRI